jgi:hypothetical protein
VVVAAHSNSNHFIGLFPKLRTLRYGSDIGRDVGSILTNMMFGHSGR